MATLPDHAGNSRHHNRHSGNQMGSAPGTARLFCSRLRNLKGLASNVLDSPVVVLCYHRVAARTSDINSVAVSPDHFRAQIAYLKHHYRIARFEENLAQGGKPAVVVTFDDGYADNLSEALPILEEAGVPATFFISTEQIGTGSELWWDALERMVLGENSCPASFSLRDPLYEKTWPTASAGQRIAMYWELHRLFMGSKTEQRAGWLHQIGEWAGRKSSPGELNRMLTADELRTLAKSRWVTIGAHTVTHPQLSSLSEDEQRYEIVESGRQLETIIGREVKVFAYPFGKKCDYDAASVRICREAGYLKAAAAFPGEAHRWTDPFQIPRHFVYNWDLDTFVYKLKRRWV
jgi:peptidoglycan/xylan/chitin deacetylase (PgdA/CDA1 family)